MNAEKFKSLRFIAKLGDAVLAINESDFAHLKTDRVADVFSVKIDLARGEIAEPWKLELHLKFNPWEEIASTDEQALIQKLVNRKFSDEDIEAKIIAPLALKKLQ